MEVNSIFYIPSPFQIIRVINCNEESVDNSSLKPHMEKKRLNHLIRRHWSSAQFSSLYTLTNFARPIIMFSQLYFIFSNENKTTTTKETDNVQGKMLFVINVLFQDCSQACFNLQIKSALFVFHRIHRRISQCSGPNSVLTPGKYSLLFSWVTSRSNLCSLIQQLIIMTAVLSKTWKVFFQCSSEITLQFLTL